MAAASEEDAVQQDPQEGQADEKDECRELAGARRVAPVERVVFHGMPCSRKKRWSVRHFCEIGARQMRHGLQHETQQLA